METFIMPVEEITSFLESQKRNHEKFERSLAKSYKFDEVVVREEEGTIIVRWIKGKDVIHINIGKLGTV